MGAFEFNVYANIVSMTISFADNDNGFKEYKGMPGNTPSTDCKNAIAKLKRGKKIYVDAKVEKPGGIKANISATFTIY